MRSILLIVLFGLAVNVSNAQKKVLLEKFTHVHCGQCPNGSLIIQDYQEVYPDLIWVSHYKQVSFDWSPLPNEESTLLWADLAVWGNPTAMFDRTPFDGSLINGSNQWGPSIDQQYPLPADVNILLDNIEFDIETRNLTFDVNLNFDSVDESEEYRIIAYAVEDDVEWRQKSYYNDVEGHPLEGLGEYIETYKHQNVVRKIISGRWGTWDGLPSTVEPGVTLTKSFTHKISSFYSEHNTKIVVAIAKHHETDMNQRQILNSAGFSVSDHTVSSIIDDSVSAEYSFEAYPNPARNLLTLEYETLPDLIQVVTLDGKVVSTYHPIELKTQIDLSDLRKGLYSIQISLGDQIGIRKLIIE